jgi:hypothetical protein
MPGNLFATLGKKKAYGAGGGEGTCSSSEGTCAGSHDPAPPTTPSPQPNPVAGREDAPQFPGTLGVSPSTQSLDMTGLAAMMAKMMPQSGSSALMAGGAQPLPNEASRGKDNYLDGMSRTWR